MKIKNKKKEKKRKKLCQVIINRPKHSSDQEMFCYY